MNTTRYSQNPETPVTVIAGEAAVVTPWDQRIHLLDPIATTIWKLCEHEGGVTMTELVEALMVEFDGDAATVTEDTQRFIDEAVSLGLLRRSQ